MKGAAADVACGAGRNGGANGKKLKKTE